MSKRILLSGVSVAVIMLTILFLSVGCTLLDTSVSFFVSGEIQSDYDISGVEIYVNGGLSKGNTVAADGTFKVEDLKDGDVVTFKKEGLVFEEYVIDGVSLKGLIVSPKIKRCTVAVTCADGSTSGNGTYDYGTEITLQIFVNAHSRYNGLYLDDSLVTTDETYVFTVTADASFTARTEKIQYPVGIVSNFEDAVYSCTESVIFGGEVMLTAENSENYVFVKWNVNGIEITDKVYKFALDDETPEISVTFIERLKAPTLTIVGDVISINSVPHSTEYGVYLDGEFLHATSQLQLDVTSLNLYSGTHVVEVEAKASGYHKSNKSRISFNYVRPIDTPQNCGILIDDGVPHLVFSKVLSARSYSISVNGASTPLSAFTYNETENEISIDLSGVLTVGGEYSFTVTALAEQGGRDSFPTSAATVTHTPKLVAPHAQIEDGTLSWSHGTEGVSVEVFVNGVSVCRGSASGTFNLESVVESDSATVIVVAEKKGFDGSQTSLNYVKGE